MTEPIAKVHKSCDKVDILVTIEVQADEVVMEEDSEIRDTVLDNENESPKKKKLLKLQILRNCPMIRIAKLFM